MSNYFVEIGRGGGGIEKLFYVYKYNVCVRWMWAIIIINIFSIIFEQKKKNIVDVFFVGVVKSSCHGMQITEDVNISK